MHLSKPGNPITGDVYYDTSKGKLHTYTGSSWTEVQSHITSPDDHFAWSKDNLGVTILNWTYWVENGSKIIKWLAEDDHG